MINQIYNTIQGTSEDKCIRHKLIYTYYLTLLNNVMNFNLSGFTHKGTVKKSNQDCVLLNEHLLDYGEVNLRNEDHCSCFVADGVGGNKAGDFASRFILEKIKTISVYSNLETHLHQVNQHLLAESSNRQELKGMATTLTGLIVDNNTFSIIHAGDSQLWLWRDGMFFKVTNDQVLNDSDENSPITSFFGGSTDNLKFDTEIFVREINLNDIFLICSDGLLKSLNHKTIKSVLESDTEIQVKSQILLEKCLQNGADDNVSSILIRRGE